MKFLPFVLIGIFAMLSMASAMSEDMKEMMRTVSDECKKTEGASDKDVEIMTEEEYPTTKEGKCMVNCLQEQFGVTKDGAYQEENVRNLVMMMAGEDEAKKKEVDNIVDACKNENDPDRCDKAIKIAKCLEKEGRARGFKSE